MIRKIVLSIFLFHCVLYHGQNNIIDSLKKALKTSKSDTTSCKILASLIENTSDDSTLLIYDTELKIISEKYFQDKSSSKYLINFFKKHYAIAILDLGIIAYNNGDFLKSSNFLLPSIEIATELRDTNALIASLYHYGEMFYRQGNISQAIKYQDKALSFSQRKNYEEAMIDPMFSLARIYSDQNDTIHSIKLLFKIIELSKKKNYVDKEASALCNIANIYSLNRNYKKAIEFYDKAMVIFKKHNLERGISTLFFNYGMIYQDQKNYEIAFTYFEKSLALDVKLQISERIITDLITIGVNYDLQHNYSKAFVYYLKAYTNAKELGYPKSIRKSAQKLYYSYKKQKNYAKALEMHEEYIQMRDSINNEETRKATFKVQIKYEYEKKAIADSIKAIDLKKINKAKLAEKDAVLKQEKQQRYALYGGLFLIVTFTGFLFNRFKITAKQKEIIEEQKILVDKNQKKLLDSINYAEKIQKSILPTSTELARYFPNHFVYFKPKDIVSGDFYWFYSKNNVSYLAVADCTGHGIPGAFMTMIANTLLNEIIIEGGFKKADDILFTLHNLVFKTLNQKKGGDYSQDGLDISLCVIEQDKNLLHFSGARNNAYIYNGNETKILKATQKSIGGLSLLGQAEPFREFKMETIEIQKGTLLILSTDGFYDQLNGEDEKYGLSRFKNLISQLIETENPLNSIDNTFVSWKESTPQLDDVLVVGIKF